MLKNFLLVTLRNTTRDKTYLILNVLGLSLGIAGSILIMMYVRQEKSFDQFHNNADRIYRVNSYAKLEGRELSIALSAPPQARVFKEEFPEIEDATRFYYPDDQKVTCNNVNFHEKNFFYADSNFLEMFHFPLLTGNLRTALEKPNSVILTARTAEKLFGGENPMGKNIILNDNQVYQVTGIAANPPLSTHFKFDYLASLNSLELARSEFWLSQMLETYIRIQANYPPENLEAKYDHLMDKYVLPQLEMLMPMKFNSYKEFEATGNAFRFILQPMSDIHFNSAFLLGFDQGTDKVYVYFFSVIAIFLLFIACINFMNLSTARFAFRSKEVGIKKVVGSTRAQLIRQFLSESLLIAVTAMVVSLTIVELVLPAFNRFAGKDLAIGYLDHWYAIPLLVLLTLAVGILSGIYPAFYLSSFRPAEILKSKFNRSPGNLTLRSILVVVQFTITIILIISTFIVSAQLNYSRSKDLGFNRENVLIVKNTGDLGKQSESFREQVMKLPGVSDASRSWTFPGDKYYASTYQMQGDSLNKMYNLEIVQGDYNFASTLGLHMKAGRSFSREYANDGSAILINESAARFLGLKQPVGHFLTEPNREGGMDMHEIIGVFGDVHYKSLHEKIEPMLISMTLDPSNPYTLIRLNGENLHETVKGVEKTWNEFMPGQVFEYFFMDENFEHLYRSEIKARTVFIIFSFLAIFVACLGLLGLSTFNAEKRIKEVGIRKVHGATVPMILNLLSKEIILLVSVSSVVAWPIVYFIMHNWLQKFAYQTRIHAYYFLLSTLISLIIAIAVVVYQSLRVAKLNPVNALKCE